MSVSGSESATDVASCEGREAGAGGCELTYPEGTVNPALQSAIEAMSLAERFELVEYIESTVESAPIEVTGEQKAMIRSRAAELQADLSIGLTWDELPLP
jgi:putative addiction module component (TIGR02574 family)